MYNIAVLLNYSLLGILLQNHLSWRLHVQVMASNQFISCYMAERFIRDLAIGTILRGTVLR